jgi:hypothetical protein
MKNINDIWLGIEYSSYYPKFAQNAAVLELRCELQRLKELQSLNEGDLAKLRKEVATIQFSLVPSSKSFATSRRGSIETEPGISKLQSLCDAVSQIEDLRAQLSEAPFDCADLAEQLKALDEKVAAGEFKVGKLPRELDALQEAINKRLSDLESSSLKLQENISVRTSCRVPPHTKDTGSIKENALVTSVEERQVSPRHFNRFSNPAHPEDAEARTITIGLEQEIMEKLEANLDESAKQEFMNELRSKCHSDNLPDVSKGAVDAALEWIENWKKLHEDWFMKLQR